MWTKSQTKGCVGSFHNDFVCKPVSFQETTKMPESRATVVQEWHKLETLSVWDVKKVRSESEILPSGEEGWTDGSLREIDGFLSLKERRTCKKTPVIQGASCAPGRQRQRRRGIQKQYTEQGVSASPMAEAEFLGIISRVPGYGWRIKYRTFQRTLKSK